MPTADASIKANQEKHPHKEALVNTTGIRILQSTVAAFPVRLMKRDLPNSCFRCSTKSGWKWSRKIGASRQGCGWLSNL
jgi:hypothetical protein